MNTLDIILLVILLFGIIRGFMKGLFVEVASLVALIAGVYGAVHFSFFVSDYLQDKVSWDEKVINIVAFGATFLIIVLLISLSGKTLTKLADFAALGILNKILGGVFGGLKFGLILSVVLMVFQQANGTISFVKEETLANSVLYEPVKSIAATIFPNVVKQGEEKIEENFGE